MILTLNSYLARLQDEERFKPEEKRKTVPAIKDLAEELHVSRVQMQRIVKGDVTNLNLEKGGRIIQVLRERGFDTQVSDILEYRDLTQ